MELDEDAKAKLKELFVALDEDGNGKLDVCNTVAFFLYGFRFRFRSWGGFAY
jgi:Ca2+-binding EF-hand superfamily protein